MTMKDALDRESLAREARRFGREEWVHEMAQGVSDSTLRDIMRDGRRHSPVQPSGMRPKAPASASDSQHQVSQNGWIEPPAVRDWKPPGLGVMDRMMDAQDRLDRAERTRRFNRLPRGDNS